MVSGGAAVHGLIQTIPRTNLSVKVLIFVQLGGFGFTRNIEADATNTAP